MKPLLPKGAVAAAQEERWKKLQEYLAARGKLKQPSAKPYLKDKTNQQNLIPSTSDPTARCKKGITLNKTTGKQKRETKYSAPASRVPQSRLSGALVSQKPQDAPSELLRKRPLHVLPSKAIAENLAGKQSITISSSNRGLCQVRKTKKLEPVTKPKTQALQQTAKSFTLPTHSVESLQEKADKENLGSKFNPSLKKKVAVRSDLPSESQTWNSRPIASQGSMAVKRQVQTYQATKSQVQYDLRGPSANLKGADLQKQVPGESGAQIALKVGQSYACSRPEIKSQGLNPRASKQCTSVLRRLKENAIQSRTCKAPDALQRGQLKQQQKIPCKAQQVRRHLSNSRASTNPSVTQLRGKQTLPLAAHDGINKCRRSQSSKKLQRVPRTSSLKSRPVVSPDCTANRVIDTRRCERSKSRQLGMGQEPKTPHTQDRRQQLEQWLKSKGKSYKRPPMTLPAAKPRKKRQSLNQSFWNSLGEEEERMDHSLVEKISSTLMECLKLAEEGFPSEEILAMLSQIPEAEKFAQFWICKAKLQARRGTFDVAGLYEAAVRAGAAPLQKLKEVVADLLKNPDSPVQVSPTLVSPLLARDQVAITPQSTLQRQTCKPVSGIKLQIIPLFRAKEHHTGPDTKLLTPVRRSLRIEGAGACYPEMLKDHNKVVASLDELMATDHGSLFVFRKNEALPEDVEVELLRL
ncbi:cytoskeleton-associated protein 2-like isoform X1 [Heteronotia binoei]|uniref:cytoskeleton-associated protein 2-like isoform X1 n=1 Tax=Heteronotia binoei TaxID=13085 RepID=UPI00292DF730|nr:cytoskeleton-associated protein 2-like isoform X1 [Heteronotia binoei]